MLKELSLHGRVALVTGGGRGIGRAIALTLAEAGADVAVAARTVAEIDSVAKEVREVGRRSVAVPTDVAVSAQVDALIAATERELGPIDILVNNAGVHIHVPIVPIPGHPVGPPRVSRVADSPLSNEEWDSVYATNLSAVMYGCRAVAPGMLKRGYGKIINISSNNAAQAFEYEVAYNSSKAALNMLTRVLALEWAAHGIRVNAIAPGEFETQMNDLGGDDADERAFMMARVPLGVAGDLRDLGLLAVYLASPASDYMTGQVIYLDGGQTAK
jgi:NAD(P)-dependent dehydrogenase (short-subunit alcohol dehydrogenase family)